jgi:hypothetical protein
LDHVCSATRKDIVVFMARSQDGTSTMINACCGIRFDWRVPDPTPANPNPVDEKVIPHDHSKIIAAVGSGGAA